MTGKAAGMILTATRKLKMTKGSWGKSTKLRGRGVLYQKKKRDSGKRGNVR